MAGLVQSGACTSGAASAPCVAFMSRLPVYEAIRAAVRDGIEAAGFTTTPGS